MAIDNIRTFDGKIVAKVETRSNGDKVTRSFDGKILSKYDKATNTTRDFNGRIIGRGDCSTMVVGKK